MEGELKIENTGRVPVVIRWEDETQGLLAPGKVWYLGVDEPGSLAISAPIPLGQPVENRDR